MRQLVDWLMRRRAERVCSRLVPHLTTYQRVLDLGCGTGHNASWLRENSKLNVTEVDKADMKLVGPPMTIYDGKNIPFDDHSFDVSLLLYVLHYIPQPVVLLKELRRVTKSRLLMIQSTYKGNAALGALKTRELVTGRCALAAAQISGLVKSDSNALAVKEYQTRDHVLDVMSEAGWCVLSIETNKMWPMELSRDLFVAEPVH